MLKIVKKEQFEFQKLDKPFVYFCDTQDKYFNKKITTEIFEDEKNKEIVPVIFLIVFYLFFVVY